MKTTFFALFFLLFCGIHGFTQKVALTETGEQVILYDDGTWVYSESSESVVSEIPTSDKKFVKDKSQSFLLKSTRTNLGLWLNGSDWSFTKGETEEDAEYNFQLKGKDLYAMLISEQMEIPLETLRMAALENARSAAPDIKVVSEEYRIVNGQKVLMLHMAGTIEGIKFTYFGYYYSNSSGTVQLITYTGTSLFSEYKSDIEKFLNGLVEQ